MEQISELVKKMRCMRERWRECKQASNELVTKTFKLKRVIADVENATPPLFQLNFTFDDDRIVQKINLISNLLIEIRDVTNSVTADVEVLIKQSRQLRGALRNYEDHHDDDDDDESDDVNGDTVVEIDMAEV